jgi:hypothetical protein
MVCPTVPNGVATYDPDGRCPRGSETACETCFSWAEWRQLKKTTVIRIQNPRTSIISISSSPPLIR